VPAVALFLFLLLGSVLPRAKGPIPDEIGLEAPFVGAGFGTVAAGVFFATASQARRERAMGIGGLIGFALGGGFYLIALSVQVISAL
jgi:hypothetical protein